MRDIRQQVHYLSAILAGVTILEIDRIERLPSAKKLLAGFVPTTYASGGKCYHGYLIRKSNKWLHWA